MERRSEGIQQPSTVTFEWPEHDHCLATRIGQFFRKGYQVDTSLTFNGECLKVHRLIMAIFLPTFKNALESTSSIVDDPLLQLSLDNVADSMNDVKALIEFVYTGQMTISVDHIDRLGRLAEDLRFEGLSATIAKHRLHSDCQMDPADICNAVLVKEEPKSPSSFDRDEEELSSDHERYMNLINIDDVKNELKCETPWTSTANHNDDVDEMAENDGSRHPHSYDESTSHEAIDYGSTCEDEQVEQHDDMPMSMSTTSTPCLLCGVEFIEKLDLRLHYSEFHPENNLSMFECERCSFFGVEKAQIARHKRNCRRRVAAAIARNNSLASKSSNKKKLDNSGKRYACNRCGSYFANPENVLRHVRQVHENQRPCACNFCPKKFRCKSHLRRHFEVMHEPPDGQLHLCPVCVRNFTTRPRLLDHARRAHKIKNLEGFGCGIGSGIIAASIKKEAEKSVSDRPVRREKSSSSTS